MASTDKDPHKEHFCVSGRTLLCDKSLRSCSGNQAQMLLKGHSQNNKVVLPFSTVLPVVNGVGWGYIVQDLETIIVLVLLAFNFIPQRSNHSLTLPRSRIRDSATATPDTWGWHNSYQSGVISITD